ncbi:MAG: ribonuclease D, partial [Deltaproteobacteria bacterium]
MTTSPSPLVVDAAEVAAIAAEIAHLGWFALDLEFMTEGRYVAELSLVQVGWGDIAHPKVAAIDPLAVDPRPVVELAGADDVDVIIHSAQADLALIGAAFSIRGQRVFDTQIAAAFLGMGEQIGYGPLVEHMAGVHLDKGAQYTEWSRRPLSADQLRYALDDVRYLPAAWRELHARLVARGRLGWVEEECD